MKLPDFARFCTDQFDLPKKAQSLFEPRKRPEIPVSRLFMLLVGGLAIQKKSFHQIDLFSRTDQAKRWLGSRRRMVVSDATLWRVLPQMNRTELRSFLHQAYRVLRKQGHGTLKLPSGRKIRAAAVDGTCWGKRYASAVEILGEAGVLLDFELSPGHGHELPTSEVVLRRVFAEFGDFEGGLVDIVLGDGAYITEGMLKLCRKDLGTHLLVKTKELETLLILQDAEAIFCAPDLDRQVEHQSGIDAERNLRYEVWAASGFTHGTFDQDLKVARVRTEPLKGKGERETFWIVTTDTTLAAGDLRELAHRRWSIENHGFRALSEAMNAKHVWTRGEKSEQTFEALMLIMLLSFLLVVAYHAQLDPERIWRHWRLRKLTLGWLADQWRMTLHEASPFWADAS